jgi:FAD/FMN-containing dehydrogenase
LADPGAFPAAVADPMVQKLQQRVKAQFDPSDRLNPGLVIG